MTVSVLEGAPGAADCVDDEAAELNCDEMEELEEDDEDIGSEVSVDDVDDVEDVDLELVDDGCTDLEKVTELVAASANVGLANNISVPAFGAQAIYE